MSDTAAEDTTEDDRYKKVQNSRPTGRSAQFNAPVNSEEDVRAVAQRVAQFMLAGLERNEMDSVQVTVQEGSCDE